MKKLIITILLSLCACTWATTTANYAPVTYTGNSSTTAFAFSWPVLNTSDVVVILKVVATGAASTLTETSDYSLSATNNDYSSGGTVTTVATYASTHTITIMRATPQTQQTDLDDSGVLRLENLEAAYDKLTRLVQDLQEQNDRSIHIPRGEATTTLSENAVDRASKYPFWDSSGNLSSATGTTSSTPHGAFGVTMAGTSTQAGGLAALNRDTIFVVTDTVYGALGDGSTDDELAIEAAITAAAVNGGYVFFPTTGSAYKFLTAINVPANVILWFSPGATLMGDGSSTLTFNAYTGRGLFDTDVQVFESTMSVTGLRWVRPQWWGALADGSNDDSPAIQAAIDAVPVAAGGVPQAELGAGGTIYFSPGTYLCTTGIVNNNRKISFEGSSMDNTTLKKNANIDLLKVDSFVQSQHISNMTFDGNSKTGTCLYLNGPNYCLLSYLHFKNNGGVATTLTDSALYLKNATATTMDHIRLDSSNTRTGYVYSSPFVLCKNMYFNGPSNQIDFIFDQCNGLSVICFNIESLTGVIVQGGIGINFQDGIIEHGAQVVPLWFGRGNGDDGNPWGANLPVRHIAVRNVILARDTSNASSNPFMFFELSCQNITIENIGINSSEDTGAHTGGWIEFAEVFNVSVKNLMAQGMGVNVTAEDMIKTSSVGPDFVVLDSIYEADNTTAGDMDLRVDNLIIRNSNVNTTLNSNCTNVQLENCTGTITDSTLKATNLTNAVRTQITDLTNANIKALAATPIELVAAPGANKIIEFISAYLFLDYGSEVLAEPSAPDDLAIEYDDGTGQQIATWDTTGFITSSADAIEQVNAGSVGGGASAVTAAANVNKNIALINTGGNYTGNASADTAMRVVVTYRIHDSLGL